jgi:hypothetical protein
MPFGRQANYADWATAASQRILVPTYMFRSASYGQQRCLHTAVNVGVLDRSSYFSFKQLLSYPYEA